MFEKHEVWERCEDYIFVHVIFRDLDTGLYHLQQTNYFHPGSSEEMSASAASHRFYVVDLFYEESPAEREKGFGTMREAIEKFQSDFR